MAFGFVELITLLLSLSGFSVQANPKPATPDQALAYAMPDADFAVHLDATSLVGNNYKLLLALPNQPQIKSSPELSRTVKRAINEVDGLKGLVKTTTGVDLATDITDATLFVRLPPPTQQPDMILAVRGKFTTATIDRMAKVAGPAVKVGAGAMIELPRGQLPFGAIAVTRDGTFLAGTTQLVKDRLADAWKPPARPAGGNLAHVAGVLENRPVVAFAMTMSPAARKRFLDGDFKGEKNFITDVITRHKVAAFAMFRDGIGWTWVDSSRPGLDAMAQVSEGAMDMLKAANIAPRGFAKMMMGALESYRGNKQVDELLKRKADIWKIVESYTGDGSFKVAIEKNPATLRLTARATGKSLSDVVPAGVLLPAAMVFVVGRAQPAPPMTVPTPVQPPRLSPKPPAPKRP